MFVYRCFQSVAAIETRDTASIAEIRNASGETAPPVEDMNTPARSSLFALSRRSISPKLEAMSNTMPSTCTSPSGHPDDASSLRPSISDSQTPPDLTVHTGQKRSADCLTVSEGPSKTTKLGHISSSSQQTDPMKPRFPDDFWEVSTLPNYDFFAAMLMFSATCFR